MHRFLRQRFVRLSWTLDCFVNSPSRKLKTLVSSKFNTKGGRCLLQRILSLVLSRYEHCRAPAAPKGDNADGLRISRTNPTRNEVGWRVYREPRSQINTARF